MPIVRRRKSRTFRWVRHHLQASAGALVSFTLIIGGIAELLKPSATVAADAMPPHLTETWSGVDAGCTPNEIATWAPPRRQKYPTTRARQRLRPTKAAFIGRSRAKGTIHPSCTQRAEPSVFCSQASRCNPLQSRSILRRSTGSRAARFARLAKRGARFVPQCSSDPDFDIRGG